MNNNILFTAILLVFTACIYVFQTDMIEGYLTMSGSRANNVYPMSDEVSDNNTNTNTNTGSITYNYSRNFATNNRNTVASTQNQFNSIGSFQQIQNATQLLPMEHNIRTPQELPNQDSMETYIPRREDYQNNNENNISGITPSGFRNGARPLTGAALLRGEVNINNRENFVHRQTRRNEQPSRDLPNSIRHATPIISHLKQ